MHIARAHQNSLKKRETQSQSKSVSGKLLPQPDRQMCANDERALSDNELCKINECFLMSMDATELDSCPESVSSRFKKMTPYAHSVHRCSFNSYHFMLLRGKDLRNTDFNLDLMNVWEMPQSKYVSFISMAHKITTTHTIIFFVFFNHQRQEWNFGQRSSIPILGFYIPATLNTKNPGSDRYAAAIRHKKPQLCCFNSWGENFLLRFGREGLCDLPCNMLDGQVDWRRNFPVVTDDSGKRAQAYRGRRGQHLRSNNPNMDGDDGDDDDDYGLGMYEVMKDIKMVCKLNWMRKVVHMRRMGARYAQSHGASESEINLLGGWAIDMGRNDCTSDTCRKHYLWNLDHQALICQAGFYRDERYMCPRSWMMDLTNDDAIFSNNDMVSVVNFIIPGLIRLYLDVKNARYTPHLVPNENIPSSKSNHSFLRAMLVAVICFVQDAKVMMQQYPCLQHRAPYTWLFSDDIVKAAFERISARIISDIASAPSQLNDIQLERRDVLGCIEEHNSRMITSFQTSQHWQLQEIRRTASDFAVTLRDMYEGQIHGESIAMMRQTANAFNQAGHVLNQACSNSNTPDANMTAGNLHEDAQALTTHSDVRQSQPSPKESSSAVVTFPTSRELKSTDMTMSMVNFWMNEVIPAIKKCETEGWPLHSWHDKKTRSQGQLRYKFKNLYDIVSSSTLGVVEGSHKIDRVWNSIGCNSGKFTDIESLCSNKQDAIALINAECDESMKDKFLVIRNLRKVRDREAKKRKRENG